jgi:hypothetical protein
MRGGKCQKSLVTVVGELLERASESGLRAGSGAQRLGVEEGRAQSQGPRRPSYRLPILQQPPKEAERTQQALGFGAVEIPFSASSCDSRHLAQLVAVLPRDRTCGDAAALARSKFLSIRCTGDAHVEVGTPPRPTP